MNPKPSMICAGEVTGADEVMPNGWGFHNVCKEAGGHFTISSATAFWL